MAVQKSSRTKDYHHRRSWLPTVLSGLLGWNLMVTLAWLESRPAQAEAPSCLGLKRENDELRHTLEQKNRALKSLSVRLRSLAQGNIRIVESALSGTGLKVDRLIRHGGEDNGQGGPFIPADPLVHQEVQRWDRLNRALRVLPLASPLAEYEVSSGFGKRKDPINRRRALHTGIDLKAPMRSPVTVTAPGQVVFVGRKGGYGRTVEVDHGIGVHTRYGHLAAIHVRVGQVLELGERVGLLGSTGRSTGPHLHYEVLVDGKARNPQPFLKAGVRLTRME